MGLEYTELELHILIDLNLSNNRKINTHTSGTESSLASTVVRVRSAIDHEIMRSASQFPSSMPSLHN